MEDEIVTFNTHPFSSQGAVALDSLLSIYEATKHLEGII